MTTPSFNNWTIIFLFFSLLALLLSIFFFIRHTAARFANRLMGVYLLLYAVTMVEYVLYWTGFLVQYKLLDGISLCFPFAMGPLLFLYIQTIVTGITPARFEWRRFWLFGSLFTLSMLILKWPGLRHTVLPGKSGAVFLGILPWGGIVHMAVYVFLCRRLFIQQTFSPLVLRWISWMVAFLALFAACNLAYYILVNCFFFNAKWDYFISFVMSGAILCTAWFGYAHPALFQGYSIAKVILSPALVQTAEKVTESHLVDSGRYSSSGLTKAAGKNIAVKLSQFMETAKLYRENDLTLGRLAKLLNVSRHHLSQVINEYYSVNFFEYLNQLRIAEAQQLLLTHNKRALNVIEIAYAVGYNNKVSFNNAFKRISGCTPTQYRQKG